jgi:hypothetical protein
MAAGSKAWKADVPAAGLAGSCVFNTMFTTLALVDYGIDLFAMSTDDKR